MQSHIVQLAMHSFTTLPSNLSAGLQFCNVPPDNRCLFHVLGAWSTPGGVATRAAEKRGVNGYASAGMARLVEEQAAKRLQQGLVASLKGLGLDDFAARMLRGMTPNEEELPVILMHLQLNFVVLHAGTDIVESVTKDPAWPTAYAAIVTQRDAAGSASEHYNIWVNGPELMQECKPMGAGDADGDLALPPKPAGGAATPIAQLGEGATTPTGQLEEGARTPTLEELAQMPQAEQAMPPLQSHAPPTPPTTSKRPRSASPPPLLQRVTARVARAQSLAADVELHASIAPEPAASLAPPMQATPLAMTEHCSPLAPSLHASSASRPPASPATSELADAQRAVCPSKGKGRGGRGRGRSGRGRVTRPACEPSPAPPPLQSIATPPRAPNASAPSRPLALVAEAPSTAPPPSAPIEDGEQSDSAARSLALVAGAPPSAPPAREEGRIACGEQSGSVADEPNGKRRRRQWAPPPVAPMLVQWPGAQEPAVQEQVGPAAAASRPEGPRRQRSRSRSSRHISEIVAHVEGQLVPVASQHPVSVDGNEITQDCSEGRPLQSFATGERGRAGRGEVGAATGGVEGAGGVAKLSGWWWWYSFVRLARVPHQICRRP